MQDHAVRRPTSLRVAPVDHRDGQTPVVRRKAQCRPNRSRWIPSNRLGMAVDDREELHAIVAHRPSKAGDSRRLDLGRLLTDDDAADLREAIEGPGTDGDARQIFLTTHRLCGETRDPPGEIRIESRPSSDLFEEY